MSSTSLTERELPIGPRDIFHGAEPILTEVFGQGAYLLGGGTGLAAIWQHRHSTDVDLFMDNSGYQQVSLNDERRRRLAAALQSALSPTHLEVARGFLKVVSEAGELGLYTMASPLPYLTPTDRVSGTRVAIERPATILARKIHDRMLHNGVLALRDLYDVAASSELAGDELSIVLNSISDTDRSMLHSELTALPPGWAGNPRQCGRPIINAVAPEELARDPHQCIRLVLNLLSGQGSYTRKFGGRNSESASVDRPPPSEEPPGNDPTEDSGPEP